MRSITSLARTTLLAAALVPAAVAAQGAPAPGLPAPKPAPWQEVPTAAIDTMSSRALLQLHRRMAAHEDSLIRYADALVARSERTRSTIYPRRGPLGATRYGMLLGFGVAFNAACPMDAACERDPGGYRDSYGTIDKVAHASSAMALTSLAIGGGVQPEAAALLTIVGSVGFELSQARGGGYYSGRDVVANTTGAVVAWGWHRYSRWRRGR